MNYDYRADLLVAITHLRLVSSFKRSKLREAVFELRYPIVIIMLNGPSGSGKSSMGQYLQAHRGFNHIEFDNAGVPPDLVEQAGLKYEWEQLYQRKNSLPLVEKIKAPTVITLTGMPIFDSSYPHFDGIKMRYLFGPAWACLREFEVREQAGSRKLQATHWLANNVRIYSAFEKGTIPSDWRVNAFCANGTRRPYEDVATEVCR